LWILTFAAQHKLQRIILLLLAQRFLLDIAKDNPDFEIALDRVGTHAEENYISTIRSLLHNDDCAASALHQIACYELCQHQFSSRAVNCSNPKRANQTSSEFAVEILSLIEFDG
jgi:hypothetical protein